MSISLKIAGSYFESPFDFFLVKFNFLEFCNNFVPDFENFYYLLNLNSSDSNKESSSKNSESKQKIYAKMHAWRLEMELQK